MWQWLIVVPCLIITTCNRQPVEIQSPHILLITMDTTRWDRLGFMEPEEASLTPNLDRLANKSTIVRKAYTTVPTTLASHASMFTGLYPFQHGIRENGRVLNNQIAVITETLTQYQRMAVVSAYPLKAEFGLARGFDIYDEPQGSERPAEETLAVVQRVLTNHSPKPVFVWAHFYDPHRPYANHGDDLDPYDSEIAYMDRHLGELIRAFRERFKGDNSAIVVVADHGEGLGDLGEAGHGTLLGEATIRTPVLVWTSWAPPKQVSGVMSVRKVHDLIGDLARRQFDPARYTEPWVMTEAMQPYLQFAWSPLIAISNGNQKAIKGNGSRLVDPFAIGEPEIDVPELKWQQELERFPFEPQVSQSSHDESQREQLASLGYTAFSSSTKTPLQQRRDPYQMTTDLALLDRASDAFANQRFELATSLFQELQERDPNNPSVLMRLAVSFSMIGQLEAADRVFEQAASAIHDSADLALYFGLHCARAGRWQQAIDVLTVFRQHQPPKTIALEALVRCHDRLGEAEAVYALLNELGYLTKNVGLLLKWADMAQSKKDFQTVINAYHRVQTLQGDDFEHHAELGIAWMEVGRLAEAATQFEQVDDGSPLYGLACLRRAQIAAIQGDEAWRLWRDKARRGASEELLRAIESDPLLREP